MDRHRVDADPDPDPTVHFDAYPDPDPDPIQTLHMMANHNFFLKPQQCQFTMFYLLGGFKHVIIFFVLDSIMIFSGKKVYFSFIFG
jgi:hypothetical protein